jgi:hypothetical protein
MFICHLIRLFKANKLGISLGNSSEQVLKSVHRIKSLESDRNVTSMKNNLNAQSPSDSLSLVVSRCGDPAYHCMV